MGVRVVVSSLGLSSTDPIPTWADFRIPPQAEISPATAEEEAKGCSLRGLATVAATTSIHSGTGARAGFNLSRSKVPEACAPRTCGEAAQARGEVACETTVAA